MIEFLTRAWRALRDVYPKGLSLFWLAPMIPALVIVPEFIQHVVEVRLGMFDGKDAFRALQHDPTRWAFGYAKIAGLWLAIFGSAGFWGVREAGGRWWDLRTIAWKPFLIGAVIFLGLGSVPALWEGRLTGAGDIALQVLVAVLTLPGLLMMLAGLCGDPLLGWRDYWVRGWPWLILAAALAAIGFGPAAWLHQMNHQWAFGASDPVLWLLMIWDSILVGILAVLAGTGIALGYLGFREARVAAA